MAAIEKFKVRGLKVELWETCFKVEGMHCVLHIGHHATKEHVTNIVEAIYDTIQSKALESAKLLLANAAP